jgi:hypothetical protein
MGEAPLLDDSARVEETRGRRGTRGYISVGSAGYFPVDFEGRSQKRSAAAASTAGRVNGMG